MKQRRAYAFGFATVLVFLPYGLVMTSSGCSDNKMPDVLGDPPNQDTGPGKPDAGPDVLVFDGATCGNLPLGGYVTQKAASGTAPAPMGGVIVDGLYALTNAQVYGMANSTTFAQTLLIQNGTMHFTKLIKGETAYENLYGTYAIGDGDGGSQTALQYFLTDCSDGGISWPMDASVPTVFGFTATPTQFTLSGTLSMGTIVDQFTKQ